ncbi:MAG: radical SAM protein [Kiritimatiellae bacterium]|nr:radical SAM protein [Kiritimatiellia bacterium]
MNVAYINAYKDGILPQRIEAALKVLERCTLCPRRCRVNRLEGQPGFCRTGRDAVLSSYNPHFGEESPLVGRGGSGTIFFTHCNLGCVFCQNWDISHEGHGMAAAPEQLGRIMAGLQEMGCHNVNVVTPSHVVPQIIEALPVAIEKGLSVPLVYNSNGYDSVETLKLLDGIFDIYMPDLKFADGARAERYCNAPDYPAVARAALKEMHRQVGDLEIDAAGLATRGLLVRHLVMPEETAGTRELMRFLAQEISTNTYVNVMNQYRPCGAARTFKELSRSVTQEEYAAALRAANEEGITRLDQRRGIFPR